METNETILEEILTGKIRLDDHAFSGKLSLLRRERIEKPVIYIGTSTCGLIAGAAETREAIRNYLEEKSIDSDLIEVGCIGLCSLEPLMDIQLPGKSRISLSRVTADKVEFILNDIFNGVVPEEDVLGQFTHPLHEPWAGVRELEELPFFASQKRIVLRHCGLNNPASLLDYVAKGGFSTYLDCIRSQTPESVCREVEESGLRGRGGGGYLTGKKWRQANETISEQKYLICNAAESDPGAFMDRAIIEGDPYMLLEGIAIAAYAIGATMAYIYIMADYRLAFSRLRNALEQMKTYKLLGYDIFNSGVDLNISLVKGPGAFVCGEETALINSIQGKRGMPVPKPPYPVYDGLFHKPTVVNNVETLANVQYILRYGASKFKTFGTDSSSGTKVFAITGKSVITGLIEVEMGTKLREVIYDIAGGIREEKAFKAVQIGGPSGSCLPESMLAIPIDYETLWDIGAIMGSGGMVILDENTCMVDIAKFFMSFLQKESCGKCIPCREGTRRVHEILEAITTRPGDSGRETLQRFKGITQLETLAEVIRDTSLCGLGQTAPNPLLSALKYFRNEFEEHVFDRKCRAGVCRELKFYYIDVDNCTGCMACLRKCPVNAIIGQPRSAHFIVEEKCIGCGTCEDVCKFNAVFVK